MAACPWATCRRSGCGGPRGQVGQRSPEAAGALLASHREHRCGGFVSLTGAAVTCGFFDLFVALFFSHKETFNLNVYILKLKYKISSTHVYCLFHTYQEWTGVHQATPSPSRRGALLGVRAPPKAPFTLGLGCSSARRIPRHVIFCVVSDKTECKVYPREK